MELSTAIISETVTNMANIAKVVYRQSETLAVANYKVSTYQVCSNEEMIVLSMVCIFWFFPGFF